MRYLHSKYFAGFIIAYNRTAELLKTIDMVMAQSFAPEKLLIVDNGDDDETEPAILGRNDHRISYYKVGRNLGPAGAAAIGLRMLFEEGYENIYWGDDNDPPLFPDIFEKLLDLMKTAGKAPVGMVGMVGHKFSRKTGLIKRTSNKNLVSTNYISVDVVAGGQSMIISADVLRKNIYPDSNIFFGFEELDYCLSVKNAGYNILVDSKLFLDCRKRWRREKVSNFLFRRRGNKSLWREYYSTRNSLYILIKNKYHFAFVITLARLILKSLTGFIWGFRFGVKNFSFIWGGIFDFLRGKYGQVNLFRLMR